MWRLLSRFCSIDDDDDEWLRLIRLLLQSRIGMPQPVVGMLLIFSENRMKYLFDLFYGVFWGTLNLKMRRVKINAESQKQI